MSLPLAFDDDYDPFDDGSELPPRKFSEEDGDLAHGLRMKRDRSAQRKVKRADLESKTRELYRSMGYVYDRCEHYGFSGNRSDLFGFVDGIAVKPGEIVFIQTCTRSSRAAHLRKMATGEFRIGGGGTPKPCFDAAKAILSVPNAVLALIVWDQPGGAGTKWRHEITQVTLDLLSAYRARSRKVTA